MPLRYTRCLLGLTILVAAAAADEPSRPSILAETGPKAKAVKPPEKADIDRAIDRGVAFLLERQNRDGSWGSANITRPHDVYAPVPGAHQAFRAAVTGLCISALIEVGGDSSAVEQSLTRAEDWLLANLGAVRRATPDTFYNCWTHAYCISALVRMLDRADQPERRKTISDLIEHQIGMLERYEVVDGGWAYYDFNARTRKPSGSSISFVTAAVLVALHEAKQAGFEVPPHLIDRAMASIRRQRNPDFSYIYGEYLKYRPAALINRPSGSLGRSQACNLAMRLWGDPLTTDAVLQTWLERLAARNLWLDIGRKRPIPHESWCQVAGYFYYFGHFYAAQCIELLPESQRRPLQDQLAVILLRLQDGDGSWWDFTLYDYHQQYGTAMALMALHRARTGR